VSQLACIDVTSKRYRPVVAVGARSLAARAGTLRLGSLSFPCALGRGGCRVRKREGDGATPVGSWRLREVLYRADRLCRPRTRLPVTPLRRDAGWCDAPGDRNYNRLVTLPYPAGAEHLWRADRLYDLVVVLDYNVRPRVRHRGSAIFLHVASAGLTPTEGCIALARAHLLRLLRAVGREARLTVCTPTQRVRRAHARDAGNHPQ
jgi:L,D-peptidoglycan transpeptidase YkuD (ErfK/YbiS/YcfS/YnhG family)